MAVQIGADVIERKIKITGQVETLTGLHIGGGKTVDVVSTDSPVIRDFYQRPFIPGSSFKGVLRSTIESIVRGLPGGKILNKNNRLWSCDLTDRDSQCILPWQRGGMGEGEWIKYLKDNTCHICSLFGSTCAASRVKVADMKVGGLWREEMFGVRDGVAIDRDSETATSKAKFDFEVVPPGTTFKLEFIADNPTDWEMGLLFTGFDLFNRGFAHLGGLKSRGLGNIKLSFEAITIETPQTFLGQEQSKTIIGDEIASKINGYKEALQRHLKDEKEK